MCVQCNHMRLLQLSQKLICSDTNYFHYHNQLVIFIILQSFTIRDLMRFVHMHVLFCKLNTEHSIERT